MFNSLYLYFTSSTHLNTALHTPATIKAAENPCLQSSHLQRHSTQPHTTPACLLTLIACLVLTPLTGFAAEEDAIVNSLAEIESGTLLIPIDANSYQRAPLLDTAVDITVQGMLARTTVQQTFTNNTNEWLEAIYVFPLPDTASVDELDMIIDGRHIVGEIQAKKKARKNYEAAKRAGKKASLLDQQRANLFTTRVANIPPGESINIKIGYQSTVRYTDGKFDMYFPLTITPRYIPGTALNYDTDQLAQQSSTGWALPTDQVPDAQDITPPMTHYPGSVTIKASLNSGLELLTIESSTHDILTTESSNQDTTVWDITLANKQVPSDRDFKLTWASAPYQAPVAAVFRQDTDENKTNSHQSFASIMLMPPQQIFSGASPREVIFVMDTSSSMSGNSIKQARKALTLGIDRLTETDTFNVIEFDSNTRTLFADSVAANQKNKTNATKWVASLHADNGTEIMSAMQAALRQTNTGNADDNNRIRQIVFVTDGSVGNEDDIFRYLQKNIGNTRLFTVGIGSAPNTWFMRKAAELGRGTYTTIANTSELNEKMQALFTKIERPVLTNIQINFDTATSPEVFPAVIPDVYMGEPVLADARWSTKLAEGDVEITGTYAGANWSQKLRLTPQTSLRQASANNATSEPDNQSTKGLDKLWAYRKIQSLEDKLLFGADTQDTEQAITNVALQYSLVTRYTSLLAIEEKISRDPSAAMLKTKAIPQAMPHGNSMHFPQGSLGTSARYLVAIIFALLSVLFALATLLQTRELENHDFQANG